ncbi:hypothetical protein P3T76_005295 [Phytophthora citrophthora]|uniref:Uncharacterized protein n=1 Tax=Phytophthora citrophthora TaxID=4793 RepID=A0AAD9LR90_9STRA|nr:hypothetical protein P3T76_005295 [Phytophthora citrophthora]
MTKNQHLINEEAARQENDQDGGVEKVVAVPMVVSCVPQPILAIVIAPLINDISRESLLKWLRLRKEYTVINEAVAES